MELYGVEIVHRIVILQKTQQKPSCFSLVNNPCVNPEATLYKLFAKSSSIECFITLSRLKRPVLCRGFGIGPDIKWFGGFMPIEL